MIEAKDILFIVLAFCALWFTAFVCWLVYQIAMILRSVNETVDDVRGTLSKLEQAVTSIRGRFDHATSALVLLVDGGRRLLEYLGDRKETPKNSGKKKSTEK